MHLIKICTLLIHAFVEVYAYSIHLKSSTNKEK